MRTTSNNNRCGWLAGALALAASIGSADAATTYLTSTVKRVYVSNAALSIVVANHPSGCPYGIVATEQDAAYDRWISLAMQAFQSQVTTVVEYDPTTCKLASLAISTT